MSGLALDNSLGATLVGIVAAGELHGVSCIQAFYYFTHQNDSWALKSLVSAVMTFDTIHQILISHTLYKYAITNYDNPAQLQETVWSLIVEVLFNGFTAFLVQGFLAMRVWRLSNRNAWITAVVVLLVVSEFGCALAYVVLALPFRTFTELRTIKYLSIMVNALAAAGDILIAGILCILLHRSRTGFQRSDTMLNILILFAINTGLLTSLCAIASLISITVAGQSFLYIAFYFCLGRLYTNSLLATLNARKMVRSAGENSHSTSDKFGLTLRELHTNTNGITASRRPPNISIKIDTTKEFATDFDHCHDSKKEEFDLSPGSMVGPFKEEVTVA